MVSITFDDMHNSAFEEGRDIVAECGGKATYYINGKIDQVLPDGRKRTKEQEKRIVRNLEKLSQEGHEIGCHGFSHLDYQTSSSGQIDQDIKQNRAFLAELGIPAPRSFAYPFGKLNTSAKRQLLGHFESCRGVVGGVISGYADLGHLSAVPLYANKTSENDISALMNTTKANGGWLIFFTHGVKVTPLDLGTTPNQLRTTLKAAQSNGFSILTVGEAITRFKALAEQ